MSGHPKNTYLVRFFEDLLPALILCLCCLPVFGFLVFMARMTQGRPIFFWQLRRGLYGSCFYLVKFRTIKRSEFSLAVGGADRSSDAFTAWGYFLRRSRLDEIPQLINVLKGEMAIIGPRPHEITEDMYFRSHIPDYDQRFTVRPGITGLAQVKGWRGEAVDMDHVRCRVSHDLYYIQNWSLWLDVKILLMTPLAVFCGYVKGV